MMSTGLASIVIVFVLAVSYVHGLPGHPGRIIIDDKRLDSIRNSLKASDPFALTYKSQLDQHFASFANLPPVPRPPPSYSGILDAAREVLDRVYTASLLYRLEGNESIGRRGVLELLNCTQWSPDWNPVQHFLDTAELMHAVGVGYDATYDLMTTAERTVVAGGLANLGLAAYMEGVKTKQWRATTVYNWGGVCNGGAIVGALALLDDPTHGALAAQALATARKNIEASMTGYGPDGLWKEGCMYEDYQTRYIVAAVNALETAQGSDGGLSNATGFSETCESTIHCSSTATKYIFDWSDSHESVEPHSNLFELAMRFNKPACAQFARVVSPASGALSTPPLRTQVNTVARMLLYYTPMGAQADIDALPLDKTYAYGVFTARRSWNYTNVEHEHQAFAGLKAGDNKENHGHLDLGSVVYAQGGRRFIHDLGADNYGLPGYFSPAQRWTYYRLGTWGHNTLTFNGENQHKEATSALIDSGSAGDYAFTIANLTEAYIGHDPSSIQRGAALAGDRQSLVIRDELAWKDQSNTPHNMSMRFHTLETVKPQCYKGDGVAAVDPHVCLSYYIPVSNRTIEVYARILTGSTECSGAQWQVDEVRLEAPQEPTDDLTRLSVVVGTPGGSGDVFSCKHVSVVIGPETPDTPLTVPALSEWKA